MNKKVRRVRAPRPARVYLVRLEPQLYKIGVSARLQHRLCELNRLWPNTELIYATDFRDDPFSLEQLFKRRAPLPQGKELFCGTDDRLRELLQELEVELDKQPYWQQGKKEPRIVAAPQAVLDWYAERMQKSRGC